MSIGRIPGMKVFRIFISSPGDVGIERQYAMSALSGLSAWFGEQVDIEHLFWEHLPLNSAQGDYQENIPEADKFDLVICLLWSRLGSKLNPERHKRSDGSAYSSGTEYEFEQALRAYESKGSPRLIVYRRKEKPSFFPEEFNARIQQYDAVNEFFGKWFRDESGGTNKRAYISYKDADNFDDIFDGHIKEAIKDWLTRNDNNGATVRPKRWWQGSPYMGLRAFDSAQRKIFFGRTSAVEQLVTRLRKRWWIDKCPFMMIFGASGSGKSSLMRAGLLPILVDANCLEEIGFWRRALLRPAEHNDDLFSALANVLVKEDALPELLSDGRTVDQIASALRDEPRVAGELVRAKLSEAAAVQKEKTKLSEQPMACLALALDQLEEIFTLKRYTSEDRNRFFHAIRSLVESGRVWVIATLRSDFYNRCEEIDSLIQLKQDGTYHLVPPNEAELARIIRRPAEAAGLVFEDDKDRGPLDEVIARETMKQNGALPLLEYALTQLYEKGRDRGVMTFADYDKIEGVSGAITSEANRVFAGLSEEARKAFDSVLGHVIHLTEEIATSRMALRSDLVAYPGAEEFVDSFMGARLLVGDRDTSGAPTVILAHESLLTHWKQAREWIARNQPNLRQHGILRQAITVWKLHEKCDEYLLPRGALLTDANHLLTSYYVASLRDEEKDFIRNSQLRVAKEDFSRSLRTGEGMTELSERLRSEAPEMRRQVIEEGLRDRTQAVCLHIAQLLGQHYDPVLSNHLVDLVRGHADDDVRRVAATSLTQLDRPELFDHLIADAKADDAEQKWAPVSEVRAAADVSPTETSFEPKFCALKTGLRWRISLRSWWIKFHRGLSGLLLVLLPAFVLSSVFSGLFKAVPGFFNYAYTQATGSAAVGAFSAVMACAFWGCFITFGITLHRLVFARQWEPKSYLRPWTCILAGMLGGFASSLGVMLLISHVVMSNSLFECGWLSQDFGTDMSHLQSDMYWFTYSFWPYMIMGTSLGAGMAMMCNGLWASRRLSAFIDRQSSLSTWDDVTTLFSGLTRLCLPFFWPVPLVMTVAVFLAFHLLQNAPVLSHPPKEYASPKIEDPSWKYVFLGGIEPDLDPVPVLIVPTETETPEEKEKIVQDAKKEEIRRWKIEPWGQVLCLICDAATQAFGGFFCILGLGMGMVMMRHGVTIAARRTD
jgi:hypothetical protein